MRVSELRAARPDLKKARRLAPRRRKRRIKMSEVRKALPGLAVSDHAGKVPNPHRRVRGTMAEAHVRVGDPAEAPALAKRKKRKTPREE